MKKAYRLPSTPSPPSTAPASSTAPAPALAPGDASPSMFDSGTATPVVPIRDISPDDAKKVAPEPSANTTIGTDVAITAAPEISSKPTLGADVAMATAPEISSKTTIDANAGAHTRPSALRRSPRLAGGFIHGYDNESKNAWRQSGNDRKTCVWAVEIFCNPKEDDLAMPTAKFEDGDKWPIPTLTCGDIRGSSKQMPLRKRPAAMKRPAASKKPAAANASSATTSADAAAAVATAPAAVAETLASQIAAMGPDLRKVKVVGCRHEQIVKVHFLTDNRNEGRCSYAVKVDGANIANITLNSPEMHEDIAKLSVYMTAKEYVDGHFVEFLLY